MKDIPKTILTITSVALFFGLWHVTMPVPSLPQYSLATPPAVIAEKIQERRWVSSDQTAETHSANIAIHGDTAFTVWYGGTTEGHKDVSLFLASLDLTQPEAEWSQPLAIINRESSEASLGRYIRKVGNPAIHIWPDGEIGIYFVTVSVGGWAASSINYIASSDRGNSWGQSKRLVTSPFLNISTLVRTAANPLNDGTIELPVYHEFMGKFSETLRLTRDQRVLAKTRISRGKHSLQPAIAPLDAEQAIALLRYSGGEPNRLLSTHTDTGGRFWYKPNRLDLPNPDAAVAILNLGDGRLLMALNDLEDGRHRLSLALSRTETPDNWQLIRIIEQQQPGNDGHEFQFSYPSLARDNQGFVHLVYTWNQTRIRHIKLSPAWFENS